MVSASIHRPGLDILQTATTVVCLLHSLKSKEWHLKGGEWQTKSARLYARVSTLDLDTRSSYSKIDGTQRPHLSCVTSCHLRHICVTSLLLFMTPLSGPGTATVLRLYCSAFPLSSGFDNVIVSFSITLFSTFTTHNYTDEENDGHQNVIINTTIYTSMSNIINNHFIIDLMQCPVKLMYILTVLDVMGKGQMSMLDCWTLSSCLPVLWVALHMGKLRINPSTCDHVLCHMWDL